MFRGLLRPGQGFKPFTVLRRECGTTATGRPATKSFSEQGSFLAIISQATPKEVEQWKQSGSPITHTVLQRGTENRAKATDVLRLMVPVPGESEAEPGYRYFLVQGEPQDPGELGHFLIYHVEERADLQ